MYQLVKYLRVLTNSLLFFKYVSLYWSIEAAWSSNYSSGLSFTKELIRQSETSNDTGVQNTVPMSGDQGSNPPDGARQHLLHAVFPGGDFYSDGACVV